MKRFKKGFSLNKIIGFLLVAGLLVINPACTSSLKKEDLVRQEMNRIKQARELLAKSYKKSKAKGFEGDFKLSSYIEKYIEQENPKIDSQELTETLLKLSRELSYDPVFLLAVIKTESQFDPNTVGLAGEIGLMQIKPDTAKWICEKSKIKWLGAKKLKDPNYNVLVGAHYFHYLKGALDSKGMNYINAYNMGINNLQRLPASAKLKRPYYSRVLANYLGIYSRLQKIRKTI